MSSEQEPPRKKQKQDISKNLKPSAVKIEADLSTRSRANIVSSSTNINEPSTSMSDSRRRSSRKNRNDELRDNEQNIAGSSGSRPKPTRKKTANKSSAATVTRKGQSDFQADEEISDSRDGLDLGDHDDEDLEYEDRRNSGAPANTERASSTSLHRNRAGGFSFGSMASMLATQANQLKSLLSALREPDPSMQLLALNELANILSMSTEDSLAGYIQTDDFVAELVKIMRGPDAFGEDNPEMMLLACRCLANLMEALPSSIANIAYGGAIQVLCQKLLEIEFIDLAEQALSTLEKISKDYPSSIVREGGMAACLTYLDFFSTNVQRIAVSTAANCAKNVPLDSFSVVRDAIPTLQNVVAGSDSKVVEAGCLCLTRVLESFRHHAEKLERLLTPDLMTCVLGILSPVHVTGNKVSEYIKTRLLHVLAIASGSSVRIATQLLKQDLIGMIYQLLTGLSKPGTSEDIKLNSVVVLQALIHRPHEQVTEILNLISETLPGLPNTEFFAGLSTKEMGNHDDRETRFRQQCAAQYEEFVAIVLPTLIDMYNSSINLSLRHTILTAILKICYNSQTDMLARVVHDVPLAVFITAVLGSQQLHLVLSGTRIANILLDRVQSIYAGKFALEGVVAELEALEDKYELSTSADQSMANSVEKNYAIGDLVSGQQAPGPEETDSSHHGTDWESLDPHDDESDKLDLNKIVIPDELIGNNTHDESEDDDDADVDDDDDDDDDDDEVYDELDHDMDDDERDDDEDTEALIFQQQGTEPENLSGLMTTGSLSSKQQFSDNTISLLIGKRAKQFNDTYKRLGQANLKHDQTYQALEAIVEMLQVSSAEPALLKLANLLSSDVEVSAYYLQSSKLISALLQALTGPSKHVYSMAFVKTCLTSSAAALLLSKLQELLSRTERFAVATSAGEDKRSTSVLAKQLRLRLVADHSTDVPSLYKTFVVSIHAIANLKALEDYLRPRMFSISNNTGQSSRGGTLTGSPLHGRTSEGLQGVLSQLAAAGTAIPDSVRDRLASLGVDTAALLGTVSNSESDPAPLITKSATRESPTEAQDEGHDHDTESAISVEVSASDEKLVARTTDDRKASLTTPNQSAHRRTTESAISTPASGNEVKSGMSYAAALSTAPTNWHIQFEMNGHIIPHETTIYGAVHMSQIADGVSSHGHSGSTTYEIKFRKVLGPAPKLKSSLPDLPQAGQVATSVENEPNVSPVFQLLSVLHSLNMNWQESFSGADDLVVQSLPPTAFVNTKLTAKLNRQLEEPLIVASQCLPTWSQELPRVYPFLFPFETRYLFLQSTSFGYSRSMTRWQAAAKKSWDEGPSMLGRLQRQKVRISRTRMLESAIKVMTLYGSSPAVLEVEYFDEVGTGLGPTLEFYSSISRELSRTRLHLWRTDDKAAEFVFSTHGLFPQPLPMQTEDGQASSKMSQGIALLFKFMGMFVARAMIDSRLIDLSFNPAFFRVVTDPGDLAPTIGAIYGIDKGLARSLALLQRFADAYAAIKFDTISGDDYDQALRALKIDDARVEDLGLDFTYPGKPELELVPNGANIDVTIENVSEYLARVLDLTLGTGISKQVEAFKEGFSLVFPITALRAFTPLELTKFFGRANEDWSAKTLSDSIKADHGFTLDSKTVQNLITVLSTLNEVDRREFLQFITGSPKLPIGGFKSLTPQFTVVCKPHEAPLTADDYLPSVMTCVNYLKLPDYSSIDILRSKLSMSVKEGGGSFHLS